MEIYPTEETLTSVALFENFQNWSPYFVSVTVYVNRGVRNGYDDCKIQPWFPFAIIDAVRYVWLCDDAPFSTVGCGVGFVGVSQSTNVGVQSKQCN